MPLECDDDDNDEEGSDCPQVRGNSSRVILLMDWEKSAVSIDLVRKLYSLSAHMIYLLIMLLSCNIITLKGRSNLDKPGIGLHIIILQIIFSNLSKNRSYLILCM